MRHILVTGATSGIGKALVEKAAKLGYTVTACGRNQDVLDSLAQHPNTSALRFDVSSEEECKQALDGLEIDIAVLNAGVCEYVDVNHIEPQMFERVFSANFFGVVNCVAALLPGLKRGNQIIMVDSLARLLPFTRSQAYGASKAAVHYFSKSLAVDLDERGIQVSSCSPGFVETPLTDKNDFEMPMKISVDKAVDALLDGIEKRHNSIYFPKRFSAMLRFMGMLPAYVKVKICRSMTFERADKKEVK